jgi:hypothetical protein
LKTSYAVRRLEFQGTQSDLGEFANSDIAFVGDRCNLQRFQSELELDRSRQFTKYLIVELVQFRELL